MKTMLYIIRVLETIQYSILQVQNESVSSELRWQGPIPTSPRSEAAHIKGHCLGWPWAGELGGKPLVQAKPLENQEISLV